MSTCSFFLPVSFLHLVTTRKIEMSSKGRTSGKWKWVADKRGEHRAAGSVCCSKSHTHICVSKVSQITKLCDFLHLAPNHFFQEGWLVLTYLWKLQYTKQYVFQSLNQFWVKSSKPVEFRYLTEVLYSHTDILYKQLTCSLPPVC